MKYNRNTITRMIALTSDRMTPSVYDNFLPVRCDSIIFIYRV